MCDVCFLFDMRVENHLKPLTTLVCGAPRLVYPGENVPLESPSLGECSIATIVLEDFLELKLQLKKLNLKF